MAVDACPICEGAQQTTWILTHLNPPATVRSCEEHIIINLITMLAIELDMPAAVLYEIIQTGIEPVEEKPAQFPENAQQWKETTASIDLELDEPGLEPEPKVLPKRTRKPKMAAEPVGEVAGDVVAD
jgi:hypothetical protein